LPKIRPLSSHKLIKILQRAGFKIIRQKGSHVIMMNDKNIRIVIPVHPGEDVKAGLIRAVIKEAGLSRQDFLNFLREK